MTRVSAMSVLFLLLKVVLCSGAFHTGEQISGYGMVTADIGYNSSIVHQLP